MKYLQLFLACILFNSSAVYASSSRYDIIAGQSKKDTLAIISSYLEWEGEINKKTAIIVANLKIKFYFPEHLRSTFTQNKETKRLFMHAQEFENTTRFREKSKSVLIRPDLRKEKSEWHHEIGWGKDFYQEYHNNKNNSFNHYFSEAAKCLAEDKDK